MGAELSFLSVVIFLFTISISFLYNNSDSLGKSYNEKLSLVTYYLIVITSLIKKLVFAFRPKFIIFLNYLCVLSYYKK